MGDKSDGQIIAQAAKDLIDLESSRLRHDNLVKAFAKALQTLENLTDTDITPDVVNHLCGGDIARFSTYRRTCQEMLKLWTDAFTKGTARQDKRAGVLGNILTDLLTGKLTDQQAALLITTYGAQLDTGKNPT